MGTRETAKQSRKPRANPSAEFKTKLDRHMAEASDRLAAKAKRLLTRDEVNEEVRRRRVGY